MPEPASGDVEAQQEAVYRGLVEEFFPTAMASGYRQELLGGGVPRWNNGVDYRQIFGMVNAAQRDLVQKLYEAAGLDVDEDLATINAHPRIVADPSAVVARQQDNSYTGELRVPVLTLDNTGDVISPVSSARAFASTARSAGDQAMLRQTIVHSAGHCGFSAGEQAAAVETLMRRLDTGTWDDDATTPERLNALAATLLPDDEPARFIDFHPDRFARPFGADDVYDPTGT
ncbi:alpha/beta hydrolase [Pseudonocardia sp. DLS-67]